MSDNNLSASNWRERYRVRISFIFGLVFLWRAQPRILFLLISGMALSFIGILLRQWSAGCVKKMDALAESGPYALLRHPLYTGSFLAAAGLILSATSFSLSKSFFDRSLLFWCFLWILIDSIYLPKIDKEEAELKLKFSERYLDYSKRVPRFIPEKLHWSQFDFRTFQFNLWLKNKEYRSMVGYLGLCFILLYRYLHR